MALPGQQRPDGDLPRRAMLFALAMLGVIVAARAFAVLTDRSDGQLPWTVASCVLPLCYILPATRPVIVRYRWAALAGQLVLTWVPFAVFGRSWQFGIGGLLAAMVLLTVRGRVSWVLAATLLGAEMLIRAVLTGLPPGLPAWLSPIVVVVYYVDDCLMFYGPVRLAQLVAEIHDVRGQLAGLAVARERFQATRSLQAMLGDQLIGIAATAAEAKHAIVADARQAIAADASRARAQIAAAGASAREAVARARTVLADQRDVPVPYRPGAVRAIVTGRVARGVLITTLFMYTAEGIAVICSLRYGVWRTAFAVTDGVLVAALSFYHCLLANSGRRPRSWPVTFGLQAVLVYVFAIPGMPPYIGPFGPYLAGVALLLLPGRWRLAGFAAVVATWPVLDVTLPASSKYWVGETGRVLPGLLYVMVLTAGVGLLVYALTWLVEAAARLERLQGELVRAAVAGERLRVARDVHDLLGLGLSAIALKADLAGQLIGTDDGRAVAELDAIARLCASTRADIRLVTEADKRLSLAAELSATREILSSVGVRVVAGLPDGPLPAEADGVLAAVLREAVTNILRHSTAASCVIELTCADGATRLRIGNDGVASGAVRPGRGLANLLDRVQSAGGTLVSRLDGDRFELAAGIPLADGVPVAPAASGIPVRAGQLPSPATPL